MKKTKKHEGSKLVTKPFEKATVAKSHPPRHLIHKYWARKPHNVIDEYIKYYTNEKAIVLDPFCGSGVTVSEAVILNRKAIGIDLNPMAILISKASSVPIDIVVLKDVFDKLSGSIKTEIYKTYITTCPTCSQPAKVLETAWSKVCRCKVCKKEVLMLFAKKGAKYNCPSCKSEVPYSSSEVVNEVPVKIKYYCDHCISKSSSKKRYLLKDPDGEDLSFIEKIGSRKIPFYYPKNIPLHESARRSVEYFHEFFTQRALINLSRIHKEINCVENDLIKESFQCIFTSALSQLSKLNSIDFRKGKEWQTRGWTVTNYWVPVGYLETNVWECFAERFKKFVKGKEDLEANAENVSYTDDVDSVVNGTFNLAIKQADAKSMSFLPDNSVDYIFTDPPYGDSIPYFGLSSLWSSWLNKDMPYDDEIIIHEKKSFSDELVQYKHSLKEAFKELYRVLKSDCWMTITFHNRNISIWNALVSSCLEAGFVHENDVYNLPALVSAKAQLHRSGSMTGDLYVNFRKPKSIKSEYLNFSPSAKDLIYEEAKRIISYRGGHATTDQLMRGIAPVLIRNNRFSEVDGNIQVILRDRFEEITTNIWRETDENPYSILEYIPLDKRIGYIIEGVLSIGKKAYSLDEFLIPIFTQLKNGRTPESNEIIAVLQKYCRLSGDKWIPNRCEDDLYYEVDDPALENNQEQLTTEHNQFIYNLAKLGIQAGFRTWIGKNEQNIDSKLQKLSVNKLELPGISEDYIVRNRCDNIDLIWFDNNESKYVLFEVENTTRLTNCIPRLYNLASKLATQDMVYVVIPDKLKNKAFKEFNSSSSMALVRKSRDIWHIITYSVLLESIDAIKDVSRTAVMEMLNSISEKIVYDEN